MSSPPPLPNYSCPKCQRVRAVLTHTRLGVLTFFCPDCEHVWDDDQATTSPRK
jgi:hypothetical protein